MQILVLEILECLALEILQDKAQVRILNLNLFLNKIVYFFFTLIVQPSFNKMPQPISFGNMGIIDQTVGMKSSINSGNSNTLGVGSQTGRSSSPCQSIQCLNGGTCNQISPTQAFCICTSKFLGEKCEIGLHYFFYYIFIIFFAKTNT